MILIIGQGVVGLATALSLSVKYPDTAIFVVDKSLYVGDGASTRNSQVIHAGIYYEPESLKAKLCVEGNRLLYDFCDEYGIEHLKNGKLIIAQDDSEIPTLESLHKKGLSNGVTDLQLLTKKEVKNIEPYIECSAALLSPSTGVFDVGAYLNMLVILLLERGVMLLKDTRVTELIPLPSGGMEVVTDVRGNIKVDMVINCAGIFSDEIASMVGNKDFELTPIKGNYCTIRKSRDRVTRSIYPVPETLGLGIHLTAFWHNVLLAGPDAEVITDKEDYSMNNEEEIKKKFFESVVQYFPSVKLEDFELGYCGIRPALKSDKKFKDFHIGRDKTCGSLINCIGIDSPGLTASLAIGNYIAKIF